MAYIKNRQQVENKVRQSMQKFKQQFGQNMEALIIDADGYIKSLTPVWSGKAVRNYIWTNGTPFTGVLEPIENGAPGNTNAMPLGVEPRRAANEAAAAESINSLDFSNPFQSFILTNNAEDIQGLEFGLLPTPTSSRSPNGMFGLTEGYVSTLIRAKGFAR